MRTSEAVTPEQNRIELDLDLETRPNLINLTSTVSKALSLHQMSQRDGFN